MKTFTLTLCLWLVMAVPALAIDSTQLLDTKVLGTNIQQGSSGGVPVGTIIAWPASPSPEDAENWLECNGQAISKFFYPELYVVVGGSVPDYRGLFLRGVGGNSGALGALQPDEFKSHTHPSNIPLGGGDGGQSLIYFGGQGATWNGIGATGGTETRPVNKAVRYLIRAKP